MRLYSVLGLGGFSAVRVKRGKLVSVVPVAVRENGGGR
jgi:hypothetical protein